jgi:hypothetical protein
MEFFQRGLTEGKRPPKCGWHHSLGWGLITTDWNHEPKWSFPPLSCGIRYSVTATKNGPIHTLSVVNLGQRQTSWPCPLELAPKPSSPSSLSWEHWVCLCCSTPAISWPPHLSVRLPPGKEGRRLSDTKDSRSKSSHPDSAWDSSGGGVRKPKGWTLCPEAAGGCGSHGLRRPAKASGHTGLPFCSPQATGGKGKERKMVNPSLVCFAQVYFPQLLAWNSPSPGILGMACGRAQGSF